jgi:tubulin monoglycylase TTLL3/8
MWAIEGFYQHLKNTYNIDSEFIKAKIRNTVIYSLESVQDIIKNRKNSHEIFGFDLMVDQDFNVWLIEVNASPCMDYSTVKIFY